MKRVLLLTTEEIKMNSNDASVVILCFKTKVPRLLFMPYLLSLFIQANIRTLLVLKKIWFDEVWYATDWLNRLWMPLVVKFYARLAGIKWNEVKW